MTSQEKQKARRRRYYLKHKETIKVKARSYHSRNRAKNNARSRNRYKTHLSASKAYAKIYRDANKGKLSHYYKSYRSENKERAVERSLVGRYHMSLAEYNALLKEQDGVCAICSKTPEENGKRLGVDHDHSCCSTPARSCGKCVRGLLCHVCNTTVGQLERIKASGGLYKILAYINKENVGGLGSHVGIAPNNGGEVKSGNSSYETT